MMTRSLSILLWVAISLVPSFGQQELLVRRYATQLFMNQMLKDDPKLIENQTQIEALIQDYRTQGSAKKVTIPVVFHILQSLDQPKIELAEIEAQLAVLNNSFSGDSLEASYKQRAYAKAEFDKKAALTEIDFCFAVPPLGTEEQSSVLYYTTSVKEWPIGNAVKRAVKAPWDTKKYLNIWVATLSEGYSGFAQMPGGPENSDGIVIDARFFGTNRTTKRFNRGLSLTTLLDIFVFQTRRT